VQLGGVLVILGYRYYKYNFSSYFGFRATGIVATYSELNDDDSKSIFGPPLQIERTGVHAHGYLESIPSGANILSKDVDGNAHTAVMRQNAKGTILITTLDPDFHVESFETSVASRDTSRYVLARILDWAESEHKRMSFPLLIYSRRLYAIPDSKKFRLWLLLLISIYLTLLMTMMFYNNTNDKLYLALSMACSISSFILALFTFKS